MSLSLDISLNYLSEVVKDTLFPVQCALCNMPGALICERCESKLPWLDWWRACKKCGSPLSIVQCCICNDLALAYLDREKLPFESCASVLNFNAQVGHLVRTYKDAGELGLNKFFAKYLFNCLPKNWHFDYLTFIPASKQAKQNRGFDHMKLLSIELAKLLNCEIKEVLQIEEKSKFLKVADQRALSARQRIKNDTYQFVFKSAEPVKSHESDKPLELTKSANEVNNPNMVKNAKILLLDDVFTTGSTICKACDALLEAGASSIYAYTLART